MSSRQKMSALVNPGSIMRSRHTRMSLLLPTAIVSVLMLLMLGIVTAFAAERTADTANERAMSLARNSCRDVAATAPSTTSSIAAR